MLPQDTRLGLKILTFPLMIDVCKLCFGCTMFKSKAQDWNFASAESLKSPVWFTAQMAQSTPQCETLPDAFEGSCAAGSALKATRAWNN